MYGKRKNIIRSYDNRAHKVLFICALVFCIVSVSLVACCFNESQKIVYADYETDILNNSQAIVNFNQLYNFDNIASSSSSNNLSYVRNNNNFVINGNSTSTTWFGNWQINTIIGHTYYFYIYTSNTNCGLLIENQNTNIFIGTAPIIYTNNNYEFFGSYIRLEAGNYNNVNIKFYCIDLSIMFGENNLPTLNQCKDLFKSDYYPYNTGTTISLSGLNSFIEGVNYAYDQLNFDVVNSSAYTTAYIDPSINNSNAFIERYVDMGVNGQYLYLKARGYLSIPLSQTLSQGSILNFGYTDPGQGGSGNYLYIGILYNNNFIPVMNISTHLTDDTTTNLTMTIPYSTNTIVFVESSTEDYFTFVDSAYWLGDLQVNYAQLNVQVLINSIVSDELRKQKEYYDGYYSYGEGYTRIYNQGLQDGSATGQAFKDSMTFTGSVFHAIGDILSMQVIPNIPLGLFVALPLLVGLLFFIVKIAKGSGG